jgi:hypothetical protein
MRQFSQVQTGDPVIQRIQDQISAALDPLTRLPLVAGRLIESVALKAGKDNLVEHGLGREIRIWTLCRQNADSRVWEKTAALPSKHVNLWCSADCTVSLWVG